MDTNYIKVEFSLECMSRRDDEANVFVGYIPALRVYSQGRDEKELENALKSAAEMFIVTCYGRNILGKALRDRGMNRATSAAAAEKARKGQYISISQHVPSFEKDFEIKVPIELVAAEALSAATELVPA
jgi:hypothetical protein